MSQRTQHTVRSLASRLQLERLEDRTVLSTNPLSPTLDLSGVALQQDQFASDHILVRFSDPRYPRAIMAGTSIGKAVDASQGLYQVRTHNGVTVQSALSAYRSASSVAVADLDFFLSTATTTPNDSQFNEQWSVKNTGQNGGKSGADIGATQAWDVTRGSTRTVVSVMDTGIDYTHPDLYQNIWINQGEIPASRRARFKDTDGDGLITLRDLNEKINQGWGKISDINRNGYIDGGDLLAPMSFDTRGQDSGNGGWANRVSEDGDRYVDDIIGWNFFGNNNNPMDDAGHGTHVAGTIGAMGNNNLGVSGINWAVQMMPVKFLSGNGGGTISEFIEGLNYAVAKGAKISNNSWTGAGYNTLLIDAIKNAGARGHIFVAAAGNSGTNNDDLAFYPASFNLDNIISVAATDRHDNLATFSNYGAKSVDIAAPGVDILSTLPGGGYGHSSGTSMATPHVTGTLALVWSQNPGWSSKQVMSQVLNTTDRMSSLSGKVATSGRVNAGTAIGVARVASTPLRIVSSSGTGLAQNRLQSIRVTFDRAVALNTFSPYDVNLFGPGGKAIAVHSVRVVSGSGDRSFDIGFDTQTTAGTYTLRIGTDIKDVSGVHASGYQTTFRLQASSTPPAPPAPPKPPAPPAKPQPFTATTSTRQTIPNKGRTVSLLTVNQDVRIEDINVRVNIEHSRMSDLTIHLQAPDGTIIVLFSRAGGMSANMTNTVFDDEANTHIALGRGPYTGSYVPFVGLNNLDGKMTRGTWKLWVEDRGGSTQGALINWSLIVTPRA